ncbi:hypothetical protein Taro_023696 [Colocasia esculenta]|uniref:Uncharacterized protein n=1 Tax=Colocasia esculenta TaxID=4460 RepID=A0A843V4U7_COLES|nr:hypothetical protein [Colocasia esculenta]
MDWKKLKCAHEGHDWRCVHGTRRKGATWGTKERSTSSEGEVPKDTIRYVAPSGASASALGELKSQIPQSQKVLGVL